MARTLVNRVGRVVVGLSITGPIFGKELRVASRRRRSYLLRFGYLGVLTAFVAGAWLSGVREHSANLSTAYEIGRMPEVGRLVVATVVWFQFCAAQLVAVVMASSAISDEILHRTLGVLMTTPINSLQIVIGKLLSRVWQILILLAISLPLLAVVRVFGGVSWDFVAAGMGITFTAVIFAASVSMLFSVYGRHAYAAILRTLLVLWLLYMVVPMIVVLSWDWARGPEGFTLFAHVNPFVAMGYMTAELMSPGSGAGVGGFSWPVHCAVMLVGTAAVLAVCVRAVRKAGMRQITGATGAKAAFRPGPIRPGARETPRPDDPDARIRRVIGSAVLWKELRAPLVRGRRRVAKAVAALAILLITYVVCAVQEVLSGSGTHAAYAFVFVMIGILTTSVVSATGITSEKESRSWPLLVMTTLGSWPILLGKAAGVLRQVLPVWGLLAGHLAVFTLVGLIHPIVSLHLGILATYVTVFLIGTGLYFGSRFKRTTTAVVMNLGLIAGLWMILPNLVAMWTFASVRHDPLARLCLHANPGVQAVVLVEPASGKRKAGKAVGDISYYWPEGKRRAGTTTGIMLASMLGYCLAGVFFASRAAPRLRRNVF